VRRSRAMARASRDIGKGYVTRNPAIDSEGSFGHSARITLFTEAATNYVWCWSIGKGPTLDQGCAATARVASERDRRSAGRLKAKYNAKLTPKVTNQAYV
jgi:hypothetical protein